MFVEKSTVDFHGYGMVAGCEARNWLPMEVAWAAKSMEGRPGLGQDLAAHLPHGRPPLGRPWPPPLADRPRSGRLFGVDSSSASDYGHIRGPDDKMSGRRRELGREIMIRKYFFIEKARHRFFFSRCVRRGSHIFFI